MRDRRHKKNKEKRDVLPNLIAIILCGVFLAFIIYFVDPKTFFIIPVFFGIFFFLMFFIFGIFIKNFKTKIVISSAIVIFLVLRFFKIGNFINFFLLLAITTTILAYEYYSKKSN